MRGYGSFVKKEFMECWRTYKILILAISFFILGIMNPLFAKLMPEIMKSLPLDGITISIPEPVAMDSYTQFYKNVNQIGLIIVVLVFSGTLAHEISKGTLINMITKGLSRNTVILAKFTTSLILWSGALFIAFITTYGYTVYLFEDHVSHLIEAVLCLWLFGAFLLALNLLTSTLVSGNYGNLILLAFIFAILYLTNVIPKVQEYNPIRLISDNVAILQEKVMLQDMIWSIGITIVSTIVCLVGAVLVFRRKKL